MRTLNEAICNQEARAVDEDGQTIRSLRAEIETLKAQQASVPVGWYHSDAQLAAIVGEIDQIQQTELKKQSALQKERVRVLRAECVALHYKRISMLAAAQAMVEQVAVSQVYKAMKMEGKQHDTGRVYTGEGSFFADTSNLKDASLIANALNGTLISQGDKP